MGQKLTRALPGKYVAAALKNRSAVLRVQFFAAADYYTPARILAESEEVTGKKTRFFQVDSETYNTGQMGQEMLENHLFIESPGQFMGQSLKESHDLPEQAGYLPTTWKAFLEQNKSSL